MNTTRTIDPRLDLVLTREIDIPASAAWRAWNFTRVGARRSINWSS